MRELARCGPCISLFLLYCELESEHGLAGRAEQSYVANPTGGSISCRERVSREGVRDKLHSAQGRGREKHLHATLGGARHAAVLSPQPEAPALAQPSSHTPIESAPTLLSTARS